MARFLTLDEIAEDLASSRAQVYALVRSGDLPALKIGGRGQWRVDRTAFEDWVTRTAASTAAWVQRNPLNAGETSEAEQQADDVRPPPAERPAVRARSRRSRRPGAPTGETGTSADGSPQV